MRGLPDQILLKSIFDPFVPAHHDFKYSVIPPFRGRDSISSWTSQDLRFDEPDLSRPDSSRPDLLDHFDFIVGSGGGHCNCMESIGTDIMKFEMK